MKPLNKSYTTKKNDFTHITSILANNLLTTSFSYWRVVRAILYMMFYVSRPKLQCFFSDLLTILLQEGICGPTRQYFALMRYLRSSLLLLHSTSFELTFIYVFMVQYEQFDILRKTIFDSRFYSFTNSFS